MPQSTLPSTFDLALDLPLTRREQPINVGQLRLLAEITEVFGGLDRHELLERETHDKPTVDARIEYLCNKGLIGPKSKQHYHDAAKFMATKLGREIHTAIRGKRSAKTYKQWLDQWIELPKVKREAPINVGILKVLALIEHNPEIKTGDLLEHFPGAKATLKGRLVYLERKGLIERFPKYNAGGYGNPNYYTANDSVFPK